MPTPRINIKLNDKTYFLTFAVKDWHYILDRYDRWEILVRSLGYCQEFKELKIHEYVFMINHIHLIVTAPDVGGFVRDFKRFTTQEVQKNLKMTEPQLLDKFVNRHGQFQLWQKTNMPILLESEVIYQQKATYIAHNPVAKKYVNEPEHWGYSSTNPCSPVRVDPF